MFKSIKIRLIIASALVLLGGVVFCVSMSKLSWDFKKLSTVKYQTNVYEVNESFKNISLDTKSADIILACSTDGKCKVECYEKSKVKHLVSVSDNSLKIGYNDTRKFYDYLGVDFRKPKITVYLPSNEYGNLNIISSTGDIVIPKDFEFEGVNVKNSTGDVCLNASARDVKIQLSTGNVKVENVALNSLDVTVSTGKISVIDVECKTAVKTKSSTGKTHLTNLSAKSVEIKASTGDAILTRVIANDTFNIKLDTGDVKFNGCDASEIYVETDTGDVKGTLLSSKIFVVETETGKKDVPNSITGGICKIKTDTGDVIISIE